MIRFACFAILVIAILWLIAPAIEESGTEIHFTGGPDPNVYKTTYSFGWPLTWLAWDYSRNEAAGYDDSGMSAFGLTNLAIHVVLIVAPVVVLVCLRADSRRTADR